MKKLMVCLIIAAVLTAALCGCGSDMVDDGSYNAVATPSVTAAPDMTPDIEDGIVTDRDGMIEDNDVLDGTGSDRNTPADSTDGTAGTNAGTSAAGSAAAGSSASSSSSGNSGKNTPAVSARP